VQFLGHRAAYEDGQAFESVLPNYTGDSWLLNRIALLTLGVRQHSTVKLEVCIGGIAYGREDPRQQVPIKNLLAFPRRYTAASGGVTEALPRLLQNPQLASIFDDLRQCTRESGAGLGVDPIHTTSPGTAAVGRGMIEASVFSDRAPATCRSFR
jgi:hypothetical protein